MPVTVVVGGQFGSEGKGKVVALLAMQSDSPWIVRCGGPNSGHTVRLGGRDVVLRQVPSSINPHAGVFCISAGCVVDVPLLVAELDMLGVDQDRIVVDPRAVLLEATDGLDEQGIKAEIGSTASGTGSALIRRMQRRPGTRLADHSDELHSRCRIESVSPLLNAVADRGGDVIIEGTQGFALSLFHGPHYPYVTSRDTTASGFAAEVGLSPRLVHNIVMVVRTFPIRVGGNSGPLVGETSWESIRELSGAPTVLPELTSVTRKVRRVARFDLEAVALACLYNRPTSLAVMGIDRLDFNLTGMTEARHFTAQAHGFLDVLSARTEVPIDIVGTGFGTTDAVLTYQQELSASHV